MHIQAYKKTDDIEKAEHMLQQSCNRRFNRQRHRQPKSSETKVRTGLKET